VAEEFAISTTLSPHYIAWTEYMVDLFQQTSQIAAHFDCVDCADAINFNSRRDFLHEYFYRYGDNDQYVGHLSQHPTLGETRFWEGYNFSLTDSNDLSHSNTTIHLLSMNGETESCNTDESICIDFSSLAKTLDEKTWSGDIINDGYARNFPKFDVFLNGYCKQAVTIATDPLYEFCNSFWLTEAESWLPHRRLIGYVNMGAFNRNLMLKLRQSADNNQDGLLDITLDKQLLTYIVFLYKTIAKRSS
ncbi:MAG: hypothetical protein VYA80_01325, partial [Pseudomonadota bacterium]|nr:hypothetical protein [Pseudomonadota bacterium]